MLRAAHLLNPRNNLREKTAFLANFMLQKISYELELVAKRWLPFNRHYFDRNKPAFKDIYILNFIKLISFNP